VQGEQQLFTFFEWIFGSDEKMDSQSLEVEISSHNWSYSQIRFYSRFCLVVISFSGFVKFAIIAVMLLV